MVGRASAAAFVAGAAWLQTWSALPSAVVLAWWGLSLGLGFALWWWTNRRNQGVARRGLSCWLLRRLLPALALGLALWLGVALAAWHAQARLADALPLADETRVARVEMQVVGLPQGDATSGWRFEARVLRALPDRVPERVEVAWYAPGRFSPYATRTTRAADPDAALPAALPALALPAIQPGQIWRTALVLKRPHGTLNPHGFDYEGWMFQRGVRARGTVRGEPVLLADVPWSNATVAITRLRHVLRARLHAALAGTRYGAVLVALALGDQAGVAAQDWQTFNRTGITHLVSISGLHVTMVAALLGLVVLRGWRRLIWHGRALTERLPAQTAAAAAAMLAALAYCLLAGWGVPARRTFFMLAVAALALIARLPCRPSVVLAVAACVVVALDPWATVAAGFWLSFGAVAVLMQIAAASAQNRLPPPPAGRAGRWWCRCWRRTCAGLWTAARVQGAISLALTAPLAFFFQQVPVTTPLANALAIPVVSFVVTPLALLATLSAALFDTLPGGPWLTAQVAHLGHAVFAALMLPLTWLAEAPWSLVYVAAAPWPWLLLALAGVACALSARGWPLRHAGWLLLLPLLTARGAAPLAPGQWRWSALDVGQGMAVLVETATSSLLYDTGVRHSPEIDMGARVVVPFLRGQGVRRLDTLVVSHADLDHVGGVRSLLQSLPVAQSFSSFDLPAWLARETRLLGAASGPAPTLPAQLQRCQTGLTWQRDGVTFQFLHPGADHSGQGRNADSCVLRVSGAFHTALLSGDIGVVEEQQLLARHGAGALRADLVLMPHHGAKSSSSSEFVHATQAQHAVAQVGALNRYGHPAPASVARWQQAGTTVWRSDQHGAITATSSATGLHISAQRQTHRRYWHGE